MRTRFPHVALVLFVVAALPIAAQAGTFTTSLFTGDADSGIAASKLYTHAVDTAGTAAGRSANGVQFERALPPVGGNSSGATWSITGANNGLGGQPGNVTGGIGTMVGDFWYNGNPQTTTLTGLVPGKQYELTWYNRGWGAVGGRVQTITTDDGAGGATIDTFAFDENFSGDGNGNKLTYSYTAPDSGSLRVSFAPSNPANTFHQHVLTNEWTPTSTVLLADSFNAPDTNNFDSTSPSPRQTGLLAGTAFPRSAMAQQALSGDQLRMVKPGGATTGRIRFQDTSGWYDWAGGTEGANILADGGLRVEFDVTTASASSDWMSFSIGHPGGAEPSQRVTHGETDYGILFRGNGGTQRFDNGAPTTTGTATPVPGQEHVTIDLSFNSFADGSNVTALVKRGNAQVDHHTFTWNGNANQLFMELGTYETGTLVDNLAISRLPADAMTPAVPGHKGAVRFLPVSADADSGISADKTYTHKLDFGTGGAANVNGVAFDQAGPGAFPGGNGVANLPSNHGGNGNHNIPASEGVASLFQDMVYNNNAGIVTLTGLTPGQAYDTRLYVRNWEGGTNTNDRSQMFQFDVNGDGMYDRALRINPDNASQSGPDFADNHQPYALSYVFVAETDEVSIRINQLGTGSFHLYGLTNEETSRKPIETLFSTGQDANGAPLADGTPDPHYTLTQAPGGYTTAMAMANHPAWAPNDEGAGFIGVEDSGATSVPSGLYVYETQFDLTGHELHTVELTLTVHVDDNASIWLNGVDTGITANGFSYDAGKTLTLDDGFVPGVNTLEFRVTNGQSTGGNPSGLRVDLSGVSGVPEPATMLAAFAGLAGLGGYLRKRRTK